MFFWSTSSKLVFKVDGYGKEGAQNVFLQDPLRWGWLRIEKTLKAKQQSNNSSIFAVHMYAPLDVKVVSAVKVTYNVFRFTVVESNAKINITSSKSEVKTFESKCDLLGYS